MKASSVRNQATLESQPRSASHGRKDRSDAGDRFREFDGLGGDFVMFSPNSEFISGRQMRHTLVGEIAKLAVRGMRVFNVNAYWIEFERKPPMN